MDFRTTGTKQDSADFRGISSGGMPLVPRPGGTQAASKTSGRNIGILVAAGAIFGVLYYLGGGTSRYTWPLSIASTYAHEMGHLLSALISGCDVSKLHLEVVGQYNINAEGFVRHTLSNSRFINAAISAAGSLSQVLTGLIFILAAKHQTASRIVLGGSLALCIFSLFYAGDPMTFGIIIALGILAGLALKFLDGGLLKLFMAFSGIAIAAAMLENWRYLFSTEGSDMAHVSKQLFLPVWFWGGSVLVTAILVLILGIWTFIQTEKFPEEDSSHLPPASGFR